MQSFSQILASPAAMQIRQLEALQNMARTAGAKVVFGECFAAYPFGRRSSQPLSPLPPRVSCTLQPLAPACFASPPYHSH